MAAALLRVATERKRPKAATAISGAAKTARPATVSTSACGAETVVPLRLVIGLKPQAMIPAVRPATLRATVVVVGSARFVPADQEGGVPEVRS